LKTAEDAVSDLSLFLLLDFRSVEDWLWWLLLLLQY
jgi:hypothetical protein